MIAPVVDLIRELVRAPFGQFVRGALLLALLAIILSALALLLV